MSELFKSQMGPNGKSYPVEQAPILLCTEENYSRIEALVIHNTTQEMRKLAELVMQDSESGKEEALNHMGTLIAMRGHLISFLYEKKILPEFQLFVDSFFEMKNSIEVEK